MTILATAFIGSEVYDDELWKFETMYTLEDLDYTATTNQFLLAEVTNKVAAKIMAANWKDSFDYMSRSTYSKYAIKLKRWLDQLYIADNKGLLNEGKSLLASLKSIL